MIIVATTIFYTDSSHWWLPAVGATAVNKVKCAGMLLTQEAARPSAAVGGSERQGWEEDRVLLFPLF